MGSALTGRLVRLEPVAPADAEALLATITSAEVWAWKPVPRPTTIQEMRAIIEDVMAAGPDRLPLRVVRRSDETVIGSTTLHHVDLERCRAEIGWTWLQRDCWGQGFNEDMKHTLGALFR
jgi:N-acetyltransferase